MLACSHRTPLKSPALTPLCRRIITTMHQRLLFLRNPRFPLPPQVQLMHSGAPHKPVYSYRALGSMAAVCRAAASKAAGSSTQAGYAAGAATLGATPGAGVFRLDPPEMVFSEYGEQRHGLCWACSCAVWLGHVVTCPCSFVSNSVAGSSVPFTPTAQQGSHLQQAGSSASATIMLAGPAKTAPEC